MVGDIAWLKLYVFQGEGEVKDRWNNVQYGVICQITTDMPMYEIRAKGGNSMVVHQSGVFLVAPKAGDVTHLGVETDLSDAMSNQSTLAGFIPLGCVGEAPAVIAWGVLTWHLTHKKPLGWLGSVLWPICVLVLSPTVRGLSAGKELSSCNDEDIC